MPLISLSDEERDAALNAAAPDLKYHVCEVKVPVEVQAALFHKGFMDLQLFSGLDESRLEVRIALATEIGLKHDESAEARQNVARLLTAWESARVQLVAEDKMKAESKLGQTPRIVQCSEMAALRKAVEADLGKLQDDEVPAKSLIAAKLEQIESGDQRAEDLREVLCVEDTDVDLFSGIIEHGTGTLKIKPGKASIAMPATPEELRLRHRRIGLAWLMVGSKHKNQSWITPALLEAFRRFSDHIVGKHIAGFPIMTQGVTKHPAWSLVLSYELEVRKRAYKQLRDGKHASLQEALEDAWNSAELINKHFLMPLTASADFFSSANLGMAFSGQGKGSSKHGKGKVNGKDKRLVSKPFLKTKTDEGKKLCFKFNNGTCKNKRCPFHHACQICLEQGHGKKDCPNSMPPHA